MTLGRVRDDAGTGASILVVEDDEQIAELMRDFLEAEGFRVRHAGSGRETTRAARAWPSRPGAARRDAARRVGLRDLPPSSPRLERAGPLPERPRQRRRQDPRARSRRRRLHRQVRHAGRGGRPRQGGAPARSVVRVPAAAPLRRARGRPGRARGQLRGATDRADGARVRAAARPRRASAAGAQPRPAVRARLGLVRRPQRGRRVHRAPAPEDRAGPGQAALHRHRLGRRLPARSGQRDETSADPHPHVHPGHRPRPAGCCRRWPAARPG